MERRGRAWDTQRDALTAIRGGPPAEGEQRTLCHQACSAGPAATPIGPLSPAPGWLRLGGRSAIREGTGRRVVFLSVGRPAALVTAPFGGRSGAARNAGHVRARRGITGRGGVARGVFGVTRSVFRVDSRIIRVARPGRVVPRVRVVRIRAGQRVLRVPSPARFSLR